MKLSSINSSLVHLLVKKKSLLFLSFIYFIGFSQAHAQAQEQSFQHEVYVSEIDKPDLGRLSIIVLFNEKTSQRDTIFGSSGSLKIVDSYIISSNELSILAETDLGFQKMVQYIHFTKDGNDSFYEVKKEVVIYGVVGISSIKPPENEQIISDVVLKDLTKISYSLSQTSKKGKKRNYTVDLNKSKNLIKDPVTGSLSIKTPK